MGKIGSSGSRSFLEFFIKTFQPSKEETFFSLANIYTDCAEAATTSGSSGIGFGVSSSAGAGSVFSSSFSSSGSLGVSSSVVGTGGSVSLTVIVVDYFVLRPKSSYKVMIILIFSSFSVNALEERSISALLLKTIKLGEETPIFMF